MSQRITDGDRDSDASAWYRSPAVVAMLGVDIVLVGVVAAGTTAVVRGALPAWLLDSLDDGAAMSVTVPWEVYAFGLLGAFGFVFTALVRDFHRTPLRVVQYHFRVPAALPLAAGVYLLADLLLTGTATGSEAVSAAATNGPLVAGLAFLSGLYVNLAYERLSALADRLLPDRSDEAAAGEPTTGDRVARRGESGGEPGRNRS